jgi:hypothetical protein
MHGRKPPRQGARLAERSTAAEIENRFTKRATGDCDRQSPKVGESRAMSQRDSRIIPES